MKRTAGHQIKISIQNFQPILEVRVSDPRRLNLGALLRDLDKRSKGIQKVKFYFRGMLQVIKLSELKKLVAGMADDKRMLGLERRVARKRPVLV